MSLMRSIFGEAPSSAKQNEIANLFASNASVPAVPPHKKTVTEKPRENTSDDDQSTNSDPALLQPDSKDAEVVAPNKSTARKTKEQLKEEEERTIFVGNLPPEITRRSLAVLFKRCGIIASARLRSIAVSGVKLPPEQAGNQNMMRKVCVNTGKVLSGSSAPKKTAQGYVVFASVESVEKAIQMNNTLYRMHIIRVDHAKPSVEPSRSVFVGNLPYFADEQSLRDHFSKRLSEGEDLNEREGSPIVAVRIVRNQTTQMCKGFGYIMLRDSTLVPLALELHGTTYKKRELRVMICGKRFKGNKSEENPADRRRSSSKRKPEAEKPSSSGTNGKPKKRRARSEKKAVPGSKNSMSKRAATEQKVKKRVKKLQKRAVKGMGRK